MERKPAFRASTQRWRGQPRYLPQKVRGLAHVRAKRTKITSAHEVAHLLDARYANTEQVVLTCDNTNTHTKGTLCTLLELSLDAF
jgi:hypothetical protein